LVSFIIASFAFKQELSVSTWAKVSVRKMANTWWSQMGTDLTPMISFTHSADYTGNVATYQVTLIIVLVDCLFNIC